MASKKSSPICFSEILLSEKGEVPNEVQVLRVGKFKHPKYGEINITSAVLAEMKKNFDNRVRKIDPAFDYFHESDKVAAGWPKGLELRGDNKELWATNVEWTPRGRQMLAEKELRYFSPEFGAWTDPESGQEFSNVLLGGGLTNRPFVKDMEPIVALGEQFEFANKELQACVAGWIPELLSKGHSQEQALAIAYSKCGEKKMTELKLAEPDREKLHKELEARSKKYGIEIADDANLTPPAGSPQSEEDYADPVNYKYPIGDKAHASNAHARFKQAASQYKQDSSKVKVYERIVRKELAFGVEPSFDPKDALDAMLPSDLKDKLGKKKLSDINKKGSYKMDEKDKLIEELKAQVAELKTELEKMKGEHAGMMAEKKKAEEAKLYAERENKFNVMLSEGKACVAQKDAYMKGDMEAFVAAAQPLNLNETGNGGKGKEDKGDVADKVLKLAEEKLKGDKTLDLSNAVRLVLKENKELATAYAQG